MTDKLDDLLERVKKATGPDRDALRAAWFAFAHTENTSGDYVPNVRAAVEAYLSALSAAGYRIAGPGEAVVPREPTPAMMQAALAALSDATVDDPKAAAWDAIRAYRAMLAAAEGARHE